MLITIINILIIVICMNVAWELKQGQREERRRRQATFGSTLIYQYTTYVFYHQLNHDISIYNIYVFYHQLKLRPNLDMCTALNIHQTTLICCIIIICLIFLSQFKVLLNLKITAFSAVQSFITVYDLFSQTYFNCNLPPPPSLLCSSNDSGLAMTSCFGIKRKSKNKE